MIPVPKEALTVSEDGRTVTLQMKSVEVADQPLWPELHAAMRPAKLSFRLVLTATEEKITWDVADRHFRFGGHKAKAQLEASVEVPTLNYSGSPRRWKNRRPTSPSSGRKRTGSSIPHETRRMCRGNWT